MKKSWQWNIALARSGGWWLMTQRAKHFNDASLEISPSFVCICYSVHEKRFLDSNMFWMTWICLWWMHWILDSGLASKGWWRTGIHPLGWIALTDWFKWISKRSECWMPDNQVLLLGLIVLVVFFVCSLFRSGVFASLESCDCLCLIATPIQPFIFWSSCFARFSEWKS